MTERQGEENPNRYPDRPRVAVGAVVLRDGAVLLVKRAFPPSAGVWAIPGGGVLLGETLREAAEREIREETGVEIRALEPVAAFDVIEKDDAGRVRFHYVIVDLSAEWVSGEPRAASDAADARWVAAEEMDALPVSRRTRRLLLERFGFGA
ncbi:MAG: NUDIX domain-containing protein [Desulfobacterales bacterium]